MIRMYHLYLNVCALLLLWDDVVLTATCQNLPLREVGPNKRDLDHRRQEVCSHPCPCQTRLEVQARGLHTRVCLCDFHHEVPRSLTLYHITHKPIEKRAQWNITLIWWLVTFVSFNLHVSRQYWPLVVKSYRGVDLSFFLSLFLDSSIRVFIHIFV